MRRGYFQRAVDEVDRIGELVTMLGQQTERSDVRVTALDALSRLEWIKGFLACAGELHWAALSHRTAQEAFLPEGMSGAEVEEP